MLNPRRFSASSAPVAELERRTQWRAVAILAFLGILVGLAVVAVTLEAAGQTNPLVERALLLQAIGQFAAVGERDPVYEAALYNRAVLLVKVGRREEARRLARRYFARDPSSPWAGRLEWAVGM